MAHHFCSSRLVIYGLRLLPCPVPIGALDELGIPHGIGKPLYADQLQSMPMLVGVYYDAEMRRVAVVTHQGYDICDKTREFDVFLHRLESDYRYNGELFVAATADQRQQALVFDVVSGHAYHGSVEAVMGFFGLSMPVIEPEARHHPARRLPSDVELGLQT